MSDQTPTEPFDQSQVSRGDTVEIEGDSLFMHHTVTAAPRQKPLRVDKFLANLLPFVTRSKIKNAALVGSIYVNGLVVKASYKVKPDDVVGLLLPYPPSEESQPEPMDLDIRYEDEALIIVHKSAPMVCHPGVSNRTGTLIQGLQWHVEKSLPIGTNDHTRPGLVHRLDKNTTGLMVIAKTEYAMSHLAQQFFHRTTGRSYNAIVWGDVPEDQGTIGGYIGRNAKNRKTYSIYEDESKGKRAVTHYEVIERFGVATLVKLKLETGRTHQIRVHMKHIGHTLIGDPEYGGDTYPGGPPTKNFRQFVKNCTAIMPRQALHARELSFDHPMTKKRMTFTSDLPEDFLLLLEKLRRLAH